MRLIYQCEKAMKDPYEIPKGAKLTLILMSSETVKLGLVGEESISIDLPMDVFKKHFKHYSVES